MELAAQDGELRAALFRFVDVTPACTGVDDLARHLTAYLDELDDRPPPIQAAMRMSGTKPGRAALGAAAAAGVRHMAHRFIVGETPHAALGTIRRLWEGGAAVSLDLLGEATVTQPEADRYAARCLDALETLAEAAPGWPERPVLEADSHGPLPRMNLSVKVSALTPLLRPEAPEVGRDDAARRMRPLLVRARELGAHLHIDMESVDTLEATMELVFELLDEPELRDGPSAGVVIQAYLRESPEQLERVIEWARGTGRTTPLVVRLVKGAYWDHEVVEARQHGWTPPVFERKADSDRNFEALTRRLLEGWPALRPAVASHNLRSVAHAVAANRALGREDRDLELQVLRGLGDDLAGALAEQGMRVRVYCPVGDLVAGMAYLVRRLLENTSNDSFLGDQQRGVPIEELLAAP
jgi:proline dehydrogenase